MCGIVAYVGRKIAQPVLIEGLKRLEYRGYDSAGVAVIDGKGDLHIRRAVGRISVLESAINTSQPLPQSSLGMAHTRWATHGAPTEINAHPHTDNGKQIALVHNGIIENYAALKKFLTDKGHTFSSQTDTEVLAVLIGDLYTELKNGGSGVGGRGSAAAGTARPTTHDPRPTTSLVQKAVQL